MASPPEQVITLQMIEDAVKRVIQDERNELWIPSSRHFLDHQMIEQCRQGQDEWRKNHEFVTAVRQGMGWGKKASIGAIVIAMLTFFAGAIWLAIIKALKNSVP